MSLQRWTIAATMAVCWILAGSCARDDREVTLGLPALGTGGSDADGGGAPIGTSGAGGQAGSGESPLNPALFVPRLAVRAEAIDLGWVTTGFSARARVRVDNVGSAPLPAPAVSFAEGSHADFSLIHNGCASEVAAGEGCELRVQLVPSEAGERAATLRVQSDSGGEATVAFSGLGLAVGDLILAPVPGSFEDFGGARVGTTREGTFSVSNPSDVASGALRFRSNRPEFALLAPGDGDCVPDVTSLVGGESCTLRVAFTPGERGPLESTLTGASDGVGAVSVALFGRGLLPAAMTASTSAVDFAGVVLGSSARRSVLFANAGDEPLTLGGATLTPVDAEGFSIQNSDCGEGTELGAGASCSVQLEFRPPRVGEELTAELSANGTAEGQAQSVALRGVGLEAGALVVSALTEGDDSFGEVLLGDSSEHRFQIQNPSAQPSGVLAFAPSEGFALAEPSDAAEGECVPGSTSLVDGEACTVSVRFTPTRRELVSGSLTVSSPLAGAAALPLSGRGIVPALLAVERELNFGRVLTGSAGVRTLSIENNGDQPLPPPSFALAGNSPAQVAAFSFESQCTAALASGEACAVQVSFAPNDATAHAVTLSVSTEDGNTTVLLLGEAQVPGNLVLVAAGGSADFGDVAIGTSATRSFSLANPGQVASGRLTVSSDNNRFELDLGDCNQGDPAGLVDGASCTFSVSFTPDDNLPQAANLSVQSPGAGRAGLQVSGRGRQPASLSATGNRNLGRANVGQDALTQAQNEFTWTVNNQGDQPTGTLAVDNDNPSEFAISNDTCGGSAVPGLASCQMVIRFQPTAAGNRSARVVVTDPDGDRSVTLAMTGLGVQLAGLGDSCVNAECAEGVCTRGVCCDRACDATCQECSAQGQCNDLSGQEACGNGAACFGVDNCKLPEGRACSQNGGDAQCGSGNCERRLGGSGDGDRICCLDDCGNGLECDGNNRCQAPALGAGEPCGGTGQPACASGLECKGAADPGGLAVQCNGGGRACTAPNECCGGCESPLECEGGECVCPVLSNGQRGVACGGGVCALSRQGACCVGFEPNAACKCDPRDNLCKQCLQDSDCPPGASGTRPDCNNANTCEYPCANGFKTCNGSCIANDQCCNCTGNCQTCNNGTCGPVAPGAAGRCPGGQVCAQNGQCTFSDVGLGQACNVQANNCSLGTCLGGVCSCSGTTPNACGGNRCVNFQTDPSNCGSCNNQCPLGCNQGLCNCPSGQEQVPGVGCRVSNGQVCTGVPCANGCTNWLRDCDGDGFPGSNTPVTSTCGPSEPNRTELNRACGNNPNARYRRPNQQSVDCCDSDTDAFPGQTEFFDVANGCNNFEYNCSPRIETSPPLGPCTSFGINNCPTTITNVESCGNPLVNGAACFVTLADGARCTGGAGCACRSVRGAALAQSCH